VRDCTIASYCSNSGRREAMLGLASSASSVCSMVACESSVVAGGG